MLGFHVKAIGVVQITIPCLCDHRQRPEISLLISWRALHPPCNHGIAYDSNAVRIRDHDRPIQKAGIVHPVRARHLTVAI